jgi:hypothetical protein
LQQDLPAVEYISSARSLLNLMEQQCPQLKIFDHFPRKLRLKNDRNVNVFCDAGFWREAFVRLFAAD